MWVTLARALVTACIYLPIVNTLTIFFGSGLKIDIMYCPCACTIHCATCHRPGLNRVLFICFPRVLFVCLPSLLFACSSGFFVRLCPASLPPAVFRAPLRLLAGSRFLACLLGLLGSFGSFGCGGGGGLDILVPPLTKTRYVWGGTYRCVCLFCVFWFVVFFLWCVGSDFICEQNYTQRTYNTKINGFLVS